MKRNSMVFTVILALFTCVVTSIASEIIRYDAYKSDIEIYYNGEEIKYDSPVITVNDQTYIPLRETAEKLDMNVIWDSLYNSIDLAPELDDASGRVVFNELFEFELPESAKMLNYEYFIESSSKEKCFKAKISFDAKDLQTIQDGFSQHQLQNPEDITNEKTFLEYYNSVYEWWNLTKLEDTLSFYKWFKIGEVKMSVPLWAFITKDVDGTYYLYVTHN